jgi:hypothetical protein
MRFLTGFVLGIVAGKIFSSEITALRDTFYYEYIKPWWKKTVIDDEPPNNPM